MAGQDLSDPFSALSTAPTSKRLVLVDESRRISSHQKLRFQSHGQGRKERQAIADVDSSDVTIPPAPSNERTLHKSMTLHLIGRSASSKRIGSEPQLLYFERLDCLAKEGPEA